MYGVCLLFLIFTFIDNIFIKILSKKQIGPDQAHGTVNDRVRFKSQLLPLSLAYTRSSGTSDM